MPDRWSIARKGIDYMERLGTIYESGRKSGKKTSDSQDIRWEILEHLLEDEFITSDRLKDIAKEYYPYQSEGDFFREFAWLVRQGCIVPYGEESEKDLVRGQITSLPTLKLTQSDRFSKFQGSDGYSKGRTGIEGRKLEMNPYDLEKLLDEGMN
jgi:hypothetical protein